MPSHFKVHELLEDSPELRAELEEFARDPARTVSPSVVICTVGATAGKSIVAAEVIGHCPLGRHDAAYVAPPREAPHIHAGLPIPRGQWPSRIGRLAKRMRPGDRGIGDVLARRYARFGGELYKRLRTWLGLPCGCAADQAWLNARYPFVRDGVGADSTAGQTAAE